MVEPAQDAPVENKKHNDGKKVEGKEIDGKMMYLHEKSGEWVSKGELKKREKLEANELKKKAKEEEKKKKAEEEEKKGDKKVKPSFEEEMDPNKYTENRKNMLQAKRDAGENPYPHKF
jgi:lysyl-tRNA synthetase class 2